MFFSNFATRSRSRVSCSYIYHGIMLFSIYDRIATAFLKKKYPDSNNIESSRRQKTIIIIITFIMTYMSHIIADI